VIQELDSKQRKIRSLRGFFLYALEIMETGKEYEILSTNLQPFFWRKVKNIIQQNKKAALQEFLFGKGTDNKTLNQGSNHHLQEMQDKIQSLHNQVNSLQQQIIQLESKLEKSKYPLSGTLKAPDTKKTIQQAGSNLSLRETSPGSGKENNGSYLQENRSEGRYSNYTTNEVEPKSVPEDSKRPLKTSKPIEESSILSNQNEAQNSPGGLLRLPNFITLGKISEKEKIEIIKTGFQLQAQGTISLKKYYESTDPNSLFQLKGYSIKYETI